MRTQLTRSITLFDSPQPIAGDSSASPSAPMSGRQKWTAALLLGSSLAFALCAPLLRHLH